MRQTCISFLSGNRVEAGACLSWAVSVNSGVPLPAGRDAGTVVALTTGGHRQEYDCFNCTLSDCAPHNFRFLPKNLKCS